MRSRNKKVKGEVDSTLGVDNKSECCSHSLFNFLEPLL